VSGTAVIVLVLVVAAAGVAVGYWLPPHGRRPSDDREPPVRRILIPFAGPEVSRRAFDAALRLAKAEGATIVPAFLARLPRSMPLDSPLVAQCGYAMPLIEAIEQRAAAQGVSVDSRVARGRTYRDALRRLLEQEHFDRVIISATNGSGTGLRGGDLEWLIERAPAEVMILRPAPDDNRRIIPSGFDPDRRLHIRPAMASAAVSQG
jgi:nucleotide-binding universal stress UspA family protein